MHCPGCKVEIKPDSPVTHAQGCKIAAEKRAKKELDEIVDRILDDPEEYKTFLTRSIASHMVRLHQLAMLGSHRAAEQFRTGALDVLELIGADQKTAKRTGQAAGVSGKPNLKRGRKPKSGKG